MELPPLPEPEPQPPLSDGDFERLNETALHAMRDHIAMGLSPLFSVQAPSHIDLARYSTVPVVLMRRIDEHRLWDVEPQLNVLLAITDLTTDRVSFEFPYAVDKPILPSGRSRFGKPPAPPYNASFAFVDLRILHPDFSVPGGRGLAITALYFDWKSATVLTQLVGPPAARVAEEPTSAPWLIIDPERLGPAAPATAPVSMVMQRGSDGSVRAAGQVQLGAGVKTVAVTLLMLRKDDSTAHAKRIVLALAPDGSARFLANLSVALRAGAEPPEIYYLIAGTQVLGPYPLQ